MSGQSDKLPIKCIPPMAEREGYVKCGECYYCSPCGKVTTQDRGNIVTGVIGECRRLPMTLSNYKEGLALNLEMDDGTIDKSRCGMFPVCYLADGCFSGKKITREEHVVGVLQSGHKESV